MDSGMSWPPDIPAPPFRPDSSPGAFAALLAEAGFTDTAAQVLTWEFPVDPHAPDESVNAGLLKLGALPAS
jgi:hypothetical protein